MIDNYNDIVIIKGDGLPTYHFAHLVDDTLMRTTTVSRGEEFHFIFSFLLPLDLKRLNMHISQLFVSLRTEKKESLAREKIQKLM